MGPKRKSPGRSKSPKKGEAVDNSFYTLPLNEDDWTSMLALIVPSDASEELYLEQLEKSVKLGSRRRFTWLSKKDLIELVNEVTNKKAAGSKKPTAVQVPLPQAFTTLLESVKPYIDNKEEIPDNIMAQLIKGKLIHIKQVEREKEIARMSRVDKKNSNKPMTTAKKDKSPTGKKSPSKNKKPAAGPLPEIDKQTQLKKKEDIEEEEKYTDDEPKDGPNHYIILSGFYSSTFFNFIDEFNIPVDCIIRFKAPNHDIINKFMLEIEDREKLETNLKANLKLNSEAEKNGPVNVDALSEERKAYLAKTKSDLEKFWQDTNALLEKPQDKLIQHIARLKLGLKQDPELKSWFDLEAKAAFGDKLFDHLAEKLFSLVVQKRQYGFYINNLRLFSIPQSNPLFTYPPKTPVLEEANTEIDKSFDTRYYNDLLNSIPAEYISPSIILHCMVEQIGVNEEKEKASQAAPEGTPEAAVSQNQILSPDVTSHFEQMLESLALTEQDKQKLSSLLPSQNKASNPEVTKKASSSTPHLINFNDELGSRLKGVFDDVSQKKTKKFQNLPFDPIQIETEMLSKSLWTVFTGLPHVPAKVAKERAARLQELLHFCVSPEITNADVDRALKQFVFETMNLTDVNKKCYVKKSSQNLIIPWDDPYPNISATLTEEQQLFLKTLNKIDEKIKKDEESKKKNAQNNRVLSGSTTRSIKFQDNEMSVDSVKPENSSIPSILKSRSSTKLSVQSVHFPDTYDLNANDQTEIVAPKTVDQTVDLINSTKKRDLTDWTYAEHYEPKVLVQVLQKVSYTHPYVDSYYNRRDDSLMLVFSNPYDEFSLSNHEEWTVKLHSNVGFRNYLEKIYDMIIDWTRDEEAKYQARLVAKEVDKFASASSESIKKENPSSRSSSKASKKRTPSPGKKKTEKPASPVVLEDEYINDKFMGHNSLKAWKIQHEKELEAAGKLKPKAKSPKGAKSPSTTRPKSSSSSSPSKKSPTRESSAKTKKTSRSNSKSKLITEPEKAPQTAASKATKQDNSFIGYEVGNSMIYVKSHLSHMFPFGGSLIKTERNSLKTSLNTFVTTSVIRDGHTFSLHLVDPKSEKEESEQKASEQTPDENKDKIAKYTCFTGVFKDGLSMSVSTPIKYQVKKPAPPEPSPRPPQPPSPSQILAQQQAQAAEEAKNKKAGGKKGAKKEPTPEPPKPKEEVKIEIPPMLEPEEPKIQVLPWTQLNISAPNGLTCTFLPETYAGVPPTKDNEPHRLTVKQTYTSRCSEKASEHLKNFNQNVLNEKSRLIKSDGTVIKFMNDGSIEVFYANGTVYRKVNELVVETDLETIEVGHSPKAKHSKKKDTLKLEDQTPHVEHKLVTKHYVITASGNQYDVNKETNSNKLVKYYRVIQGHDSQSGETMVSREDNIKMIFRSDGSSLVDFEDGTRITTFFVYSEASNQDLGEFKTSNNETYKREKYVKIECPGFATTIFNAKTTECTLAFATGTLIACDPNKMSYNLVYHTGETLDVSSEGSVAYLPRNGNQLAKNKFLFSQNTEFILDHEDEVGNRFRVNKNGKNFILSVNNNNKTRHNVKIYGKHSPRFFIIHKDSSGTELLRHEDVSDYLAEVEVDPMTAIIRDNIQGYPNIMGTTVLRPLRNCLTDAWISEYDEKDITPIGLRCRNLLNFPPNPEVKVPGPKFGTTVGRGINVDLNPNKRVKNPAITIAKRMEFRQLIEYQKLSDDMRSKLILGLK